MRTAPRPRARRRARGTRPRPVVTTAVLITLVAAAVGSGLAVVRTAPALADGSRSTDTAAQATPPSTLAAVGDLVVRRLALATPVAESKWLSGAPIADPAREQAVVDAGVARARADGVDPVLVERVLRDQIAASKLVQRGLFTRWTHEPDLAPTTAPDLASVRTQITQLDDQLVDGLAAVAGAAGQPRCTHVVVAERHRVDPGLDSLTRKALHVAWSHFCEDEPTAS
ncbi:gamma subclass chorismate mutase AroQ [Curtobacterium luteum]|uniref:gamma subclass chorismate mutase AroQ n=1 Tax=Curtobacterium luteum TaxID=33881 RepID=UPI0037F83BA3